MSLFRKTCEHINARAALHDASERVDMFASRIIFNCQRTNPPITEKKARSTLYLHVLHGLKKLNKRYLKFLV